MAHFTDDITYPFKSMGFTMYKDYGICDTCGDRVEHTGIFGWAEHFSECAGKGFVDSVKKIESMPLLVNDKMDLVKGVFNIEQ